MSIPSPAARRVPPAGDSAPVLTVIVKAWNEERHIASCMRSVLAELAHMRGEVILVDSMSADRTVEVAKQFDVQIVQLASTADRSCGAALQLGYQFARGHYIYVLDADMTLVPGFLRLAIDYLDAHPGVAGVGGGLVDVQLNNLADKQRAARYATLRQEQAVTSLGGGGMYRRDAIETVGYLAHRWLLACEEAELGARLASAGWGLMRLADAAVTHCGHDEGSLQMLRRLWCNGRMRAYGVFLRSALGRPWLGAAIRVCWFIFVAPTLALAALAIGALCTFSGQAFTPAWGAAQLALWGAAFCVQLWRKKSATLAAIALLSWHMYALAAITGLFRAVGDPSIAVPARVLRRG